MNQPSLRPDRRHLRIWISLLLLLLLGTVPAMAQSECPRPNNGWLDCATPWAPAPASLWGELQPADTTTTLTHGARDLNRRDITNFNEFSGPEAGVPWFMSLDVENDLVFVAAGYRLQVWKPTFPAGSSDPVQLDLKGEVKGQGSGLGNFPFLYQGESSTPLLDVDAPAGVSNVVAIIGYANMGISIASVDAGGTPSLLYQESSRSANEVYAARIGTTNYAFMAQTKADIAPTVSSLLVYNMTQAVSGGRCHSPNQTCPGVLLGRIGDRAAAFVDGVGNYVVYSAGTSGGYQILDVSNPAQAQVKLTDLVGKPTYGVAMWSQGGKYYVATVTISGIDYLGNIYDVSCVASAAGCTAAPPLVSSMPVRRGSANNYVTFSRAAGTPFLHYGTDDWSGQRSYDREFLVDVTNPASPRVVSPTGYFSWTHNYNFVRPGRGKFMGQYFFRAAEGILDTHRLVGNLPPVADFSWSPAEVYPGTPVTFTDQSLGQPTSWSWTFADGTPASSAVQAPPAVTFPAPGARSIGLTATNGAGSNPKSRTLTVLDPKPVIAGVSVSQGTALICSQLTLSSTGVTGKPALTYAWEIRNAANDLMASGNQPSLAWTSPSTAGAGTYTGKLTVSNLEGTAEKSVSFTLESLPLLAWQQGSPTSPPAPTFDAVTAGPVTFHAPAATGATTWQWDFGDGSPLLVSSDPVQGPNPTHSYAVAGTMNVTVKIWNCVTGDVGGLISAAVAVTVNPESLKADFLAEGSGILTFPVNQSITFVDNSTGAELWDFDWNGDGDYDDSVDQTNLTAASFTIRTTDGKRTITHTYTTSGGVRPVLRVRRGSETSTFKHPSIFISSGTTPPPPPPPPQGITVGGPSSGNVGQALTFSATASGCSPAASGWTWNVGGGTGSSNTSSISITWSSGGTKTISATNSGCGSFSGSLSVTIGNPSGGPLAPAFTFLPAAPKAGETVSFNGSASTGGATSFSWAFGDGSNAVGATATHAFAQDGTYQVKLTLTKSGTGEGCFNGVCIASLTKAVLVGQGQVSADFTTSAPCVNRFGVVQCDATTGEQVTLTAVATDGASYSWDFGDETTGTGGTTTHAWQAPRSYSVKLTVTRGGQSATVSRVFLVTGAALARSVVLPSVAQTEGPVVQTTDLYVHNPGSLPIEVTLEFRKRGTPDVNPPRATRTIAPGATLLSMDVLHELFGRDPNQFGFVSVVNAGGSIEPVITSFNTTFQDDGAQFGQTIPGFSTSVPGSQSIGGPEVQHLVGLSDDDSRVSYFGISNPNDAPATYKLRFFDKTGHLLGTSETLSLSRFGQKQFQVREIRDFGVESVGDYRVEVETLTGGPLLPYGAILRAGSDDPSFVAGSRGKKSKVYLIGALSVPGQIGIWKSDVVLANVAGKALSTEMGFARVGIGFPPEDPVALTLQPGATERMIDVLNESWGIDDATGVLTFESQGDGGIFPVIQGESYYSSGTSRKFGQAMQAFTDEDAAGPGQGQYLVGLRQDAQYRTTFWLFNPGSESGTYDVIYRKLDGTILGRIDNVGLAPGRSRQFRPVNHQIPEGGVAGGFTVQVIVKSGKLLAAGQVVNVSTSDPAYIAGEKR